MILTKKLLFLPVIVFLLSSCFQQQAVITESKVKGFIAVQKKLKELGYQTSENDEVKKKEQFQKMDEISKQYGFSGGFDFIMTAQKIGIVMSLVIGKESMKSEEGENPRKKELLAIVNNPDTPESEKQEALKELEEIQGVIDPNKVFAEAFFQLSEKAVDEQSYQTIIKYKKEILEVFQPGENSFFEK